MTRSQVFSLLFAAKNEHTIDIGLNFSKSAVEDFVTFMTSDYVKHLADNAVELFLLAERFQVTKLKAVCERVIVARALWE